MMAIYVFDEKILHSSHVTGFRMQLVICYYNQFSYKYCLQLKTSCKRQSHAIGFLLVILVDD